MGRKKIELIAPGGSLKKIEYAFDYGANAVYAGLPDFSLRARINEFTPEKIEKAVELARKLGKKIYFTLNIYAHERHLGRLKKHLKFIAKVKPDAIIASDPGIVSLAKKLAPKIKIHLSTQANTTNSEAVSFWKKQGISRIILAREVTLEEIKKIRRACPEMELEYFVHGAMCMSYSGRCLLSNWMRGRSANLGDCAQPCRWPYQSSGLEFPISPLRQSSSEASNFQFPKKSQDQNSKDQKLKQIIIEEDNHGTYIFNSKDLCLIEHLDELTKAGVNAIKIEGRTKSAYYVACAVKAYRQVLDAINSGKRSNELQKIVGSAKKELGKLVNRGYSTGFLFGKDKWENDLERSHKGNKWQFVGEIISQEKPGRAHTAKSRRRRVFGKVKEFSGVKVHNVLKEGEKVEVIAPEKIYSDKVREIKNMKGEKIKSAHGGSRNTYEIRFSRDYPEKFLLRKKQFGKRGDMV